MGARRSLDELEAKPTIAQAAHHEPASFVWRVGLVVTPAAERHQLIQIEVGSALGALEDVMDIQASPHATGLATPARSREHLRPNRRPFGGAGGTAAHGPRASASHSSCGRLS